jgi:hypothetical protein
MNPFELMFKYNQTEKKCLESVKINGLALQFVLHKTPEIVLEAVRQNPKAKQFILGSCFDQRATTDQKKEFNNLINNYEKNNL